MERIIKLRTMTPKQAIEVGCVFFRTDVNYLLSMQDKQAKKLFCKVKKNSPQAVCFLVIVCVLVYSLRLKPYTVSKIFGCDFELILKCIEYEKKKPNLFNRKICDLVNVLK